MNIDFHCHLDLYPDPFKIAAECMARGTYVLSVTTTPTAWKGTSKLAKGSQRIRTALGLHPELAHQRAHELEIFDEILPDARYIGEIGLDGSKAYKNYHDIQLKVFRHILKSTSRVGGRIMSVHSRGSVGAILEELAHVDGTPILHWFTGTQNQLRKAIDIGCWFSVGPAMLSTKKGSSLVSMIPKTRLITETDGPFAKYNKKPLLPWDVESTTQQLSNIWKCNDSSTTEILSQNFKKLLTHCKE